MSPLTDTYNLAFSFAGEDREYVEQIKTECEELGLKVYYDKDRKIDQWGKSFIQEQRKVYSGYTTKHFVPFISEYYFSKSIPTDEFKSALMESTQRSRYILPIKIDDSTVSEEYLHRDIQYLKKDEYTPQQLAGALKYIVDSSKDPAKNVDQLLKDELELPALKTIPSTYSKYESAEQLITYVANKFEENLQKLKAEGYAPVVRADREKLKIVVEKGGDTVFSLNLFFSNTSTNSIGFNFDSRSMLVNTQSENGTIEPIYDKEKQKSGFIINDYSYSRFNEEKVLSKEDVVRFFWENLKETLERDSDRKNY